MASLQLQVWSGFYTSLISKITLLITMSNSLIRNKFIYALKCMAITEFKLGLDLNNAQCLVQYIKILGTESNTPFTSLDHEQLLAV